MKLPVFQELENSHDVLLAGAGGGFDIFAGLPLYFSLRSAGKSVHLANLSFTALGYCRAERPVPSLCCVLPSTTGPSSYFPELYLAQWLAKHGCEMPVYAIEQTGARSVADAYEWLATHLHLDTVIVVDGGMDSLMRGDEFCLGTPEEDMASLAAANAVAGPARQLLVCTGFGIDAFHGICHAQFLENVAALIKEGGYLGAWSLTREMAEFRLYEEACQYVFARMPGRPSIVNSSILSAVNGEFGDHHATGRTAGSKLFINPLMGLYWAFKLECVARRNLFLPQIKNTEDYAELSNAIHRFRATVPKPRPWTQIPC